MVKWLRRLLVRESIRPAADASLHLLLRKRFGIKTKEISLYKTALTHKSTCTNRSKNQRVDNERLEYLGDSILDAIVAEYLFSFFSHKDEGFLTKMRSRIVSRAGLNAIAIAIGLDSMVMTQTTNPLAQKHIFGDALEAFVGAMYLDKGFIKTKKWVVKHILKKHVNLKELQTTETDYKSRIIEWAQKFRYSISFSSEEKPEGGRNNPNFECILELNGTILGSGFGNTKKEAEQNAAMVALERIDIVSPENKSTVPSGQEYSQN